MTLIKAASTKRKNWLATHANFDLMSKLKIPYLPVRDLSIGQR